jgi:hypothetical protein
MKLSNPENAVADVRKLRDYCLNPEHPRGKHKAPSLLRRPGLGRRRRRRAQGDATVRRPLRGGIHW